jgi:transketolase
MSDFKGSREAFVAGMLELAQADSKVVFVSADSVKAARATAFIERFPNRYFEVGIAEQSAVAMAAGLASCGLKPYLITYGGFITMRACEQVRTFVAYPGLNVKLVGLNGGLIGGEREGVTHQAIEDVGIMRAIPGISVIAPADGMQTYLLCIAAAKLEGPVYFRIGSGKEPDISPMGEGTELGRLRKVLANGSDVALLSSGFVLDRVLAAAGILKKEGIRATVADVHMLKPLDSEGILALLRDCAAAVTVEDHNVIGGLGSAVAELCADQLPTPIVRLGIDDVFPESGPADALADKYGLSAENIAAAARKAIQKKTRGVGQSRIGP